MVRSSGSDDVLDIFESLLQAQLKAVKEIRRKRGSNADTVTSEPSDECASRKRMSQPDMAQEVLVEAGSPLHIREIIKRIETTFGVAVSRDSLVSSVLKKVARGEMFVKAGKNTFGLLGRD